MITMTMPADEDFRITAVSEALLEHTDLWTSRAGDGVVFDTELAAVVAVTAIEKAKEERELERECRYACHQHEQGDMIGAIRRYAEQNPEYRVMAEQLVLMVMDA